MKVYALVWGWLENKVLINSDRWHPPVSWNVGNIMLGRKKLYAADIDLSLHHSKRWTKEALSQQTRAKNCDWHPNRTLPSEVSPEKHWESHGGQLSLLQRSHRICQTLVLGVWGSSPPKAIPPGIEASRPRTGDGYSPQKGSGVHENTATRLVNRAGSYNKSLGQSACEAEESALRPSYNL